MKDIKFRYGNFALVVAGSVLLGLIAAYPGTASYDDPYRYRYSLWLLAQYGLSPGITAASVPYGTLWELILAVVTEILLPFLRDPFYLRHAITFALFPAGLYAMTHLLRRAGYSLGTALLSTSVLIGFIRLGGHHLVNVKDAPAATAFLLCALGSWLLLRSLSETVSVRKLIAIGIVSILPYAIRTPLLGIFALTMPALLVMAIRPDKKLKLRSRLAMIIIPLFSASLFLFLLFPQLWTMDITQWLKPIEVFSNYQPYRWYTRIFGITMRAQDVAWWYSLAFIPVIIQPLALTVCFIGLVNLSLHYPKTPSAFVARFGRFTLPVQLPYWLLAHSALALAYVITAGSTLYDEERHMLFAYTVLFAGLSLGCDYLKEQWKLMLACAVTVTSLIAYSNWGIYSYIYKSPLILNRDSGQFMHEYWGLCINRAVLHLPDGVPPGTSFDTWPEPIGEIQLSRLQNSLVFRDTRFASYRFNKGAHLEPVYAYIHHNREGTVQQGIKDLASGSGRLG